MLLRTFLKSMLATTICAGAVVTGTAKADDAAYPSRAVTIIYPYAVGSAPDAIIRLIAGELSATLHQPFVVESRAGAAGSIGGRLAARAPADGYTLLFGDTGGVFAINSLREASGYDSRKAFAPITKVTTSPAFLMVGNNSPIKSVRDLTARANGNPAGLSYGSNGVGSSFHLMIERFGQLTQTRNLIHIPFKGSPETNQALMGGHIDFALNGGLANIKAGRGRALAVAADKRSPQAPDVPTIAEATGIKGYSESEWWALAAPAGTPAPVIQKLNAAVRDVIARPEFQAKFAELGFEFEGGSPDELGEIIRQSIQKWKDVARESNITL